MQWLRENVYRTESRFRTEPWGTLTSKGWVKEEESERE